MKHFYTKVLMITGLTASPLLVMAQSVATPPACATSYTLACLVGKIIQYLEIGIMLIISLAVVTFVWNVYQYFFKVDAENKKEAGMYVLYSVIGFFVILSFWGLVAIVSNTLNLPKTQPMWPFGSGMMTQAPATDPFKGGALPGGTNPGGTLPGGTNPGGTLPGGTNPRSTLPGGTNPGGSLPEGTNNQNFTGVKPSNLNDGQ